MANIQKVQRVLANAGLDHLVANIFRGSVIHISVARTDWNKTRNGREDDLKAASVALTMAGVDILPSLRSCGSDFSCFAKRNGGASTLPRSRPRPGARPVPLTPT